MKNLLKKLFKKQKPKGWFHYENVAAYVEVGQKISLALKWAEGKPSRIELEKSSSGGSITIRWFFKEKGFWYDLRITGRDKKVKDYQHLEGEPDVYLDYVVTSVSYEVQ